MKTDLFPQAMRAGHLHAGRMRRPRVTAHLTDEDWWALETHLRLCARPGSENPLLEGILRQKIAFARPVVGPVPPDLAVAGRRVRYMTSGCGARSGLLSHAGEGSTVAGAIPVRSLLGATLIGMRAMQRAPLLREDGSIATIVLLDVHAETSTCPDRSTPKPERATAPATARTNERRER